MPQVLCSISVPLLNFQVCNYYLEPLTAIVQGNVYYEIAIIMFDIVPYNKRSVTVYNFHWIVIVVMWCDRTRTFIQEIVFITRQKREVGCLSIHTCIHLTSVWCQ